MRYPAKKKQNTKKIVLISLAALLVVAVGVFAAYRLTHKPAEKASQASRDAALETKIGKENANNKGSSPLPGTDTDGADNGTKNTPAPSTPTNGDVTPFISYFGYATNKDGSPNISQLEVDSYVPVILESGTCTLTLTIQGQAPITRTETAAANVSTTNCKAFLVDVASLPVKGNWTATVSYSSPAHTGASKPERFTVQ